MRRPGMPPIPLRITMSHRLGDAFVHDIRVGVGRASFRFGLDAYVNGRGVMRVGPSVQAGPEFDQGALIALWGEALNFPAAWDRRPDIRWRPIDEHAATLVIPGEDDEIPIGVTFDALTGYPTSCEANRHKGTGGKVPWRGTSSKWRRFDGGVLAPGRFQVKWSDEPRPWLDIVVDSVVVNAPVDAALEMARRVLASAPRPRLEGRRLTDTNAQGTSGGSMG
jgi:hypothetical protein